MDFKPKISYWVSLIFIAASLSLAVTDDVKVTGKVGDPSSPVYAGLNKDVTLICDLGKVGHVAGANNGSIKAHWSFRNPAGLTQTISITGALCTKANSSTAKEKESDDDKMRKPFSDCDVHLDKDNPSLFVLKIEDVIEPEFGDYVCQSGDGQNSNKTFHLQEIVTLARLPKKGKAKIEDLTIDEGEPFNLYCNATGLRDWHAISWWKDGDNITGKLKSFSGLFENFNRTNDLNYKGTATLELRGNYTCRVDLRDEANSQFKQFLSRNGSHNPYPVEFEAFYRVKEGDRWKLPLYVLLGEIAFIGLFTVIVNIKEKRAAEGEADGQYEDSDDEDEVPSRQNGNGVSNSKRNSSSSLDK